MIAGNQMTTAPAGLSEVQRALLEKRLRGGLKPKSAPKAIPRRTDTGMIPLSFAQERLWFLDQLAPNTPLYNIPAAFSIKGSLDVEALRKAIELVVQRHETLRSRFLSVDGAPMQLVTEP